MRSGDKGRGVPNSRMAMIRVKTTQIREPMETRVSWAKERLSLQLALKQMEQELDQCRADLRVERDQRSSVCTGSTCGRTVTGRPWSTRRSTCSCYWGDSRTVSRPPD